MTSIARSLGAPVIEPQGKSARERIDRGDAVAARRDGRDHLVDGRIALDIEQRRHRDLPGRATRVRSLRIRSTIIRFSARCLGSAAQLGSRAASSADVAPRRAVPFIGFAVKPPPSRVKNSSGEKERIQRLAGEHQRAIARTRARRAAARRAPCGWPANGTSARKVRLA
jgi:hypothetical protein